MILTLIGTISFAQVIFQVQSPAPVAANYPNEYTEPAPGGGWGNLDLTDPANSITGTLMFVDAPGGDTIACFALTTNLTGKIAVLYREDCEFGVKALNAQNQGAIGVVIINNVIDAPIKPGAGASGINVTIPVIHIYQADGALLRDDIIAGNVTAFIGAKMGYLPNDIGTYEKDVVLARRSSNLSSLSTDASEFSVVTGLWVRNFGNQPQSNIDVDVNISYASSSVYSNSVNIPTFAVGDSIFVALGVFSQASYPVGDYTMTYTITNSVTDDDPTDNVRTSVFRIDPEIYTYARLDPSTHEVLSSSQSRANFDTDYGLCITFDDPNASRVEAAGLTFSAVTNEADVLTGDYVEIKVYQWDDVFTDIDDPNFGYTDINLITSEYFIYDGDYQDSIIYVPFTTFGNIPLLDNQRYLFCVTTESLTMFINTDNVRDYKTTTDSVVKQIVAPIEIDGRWISSFTGSGSHSVPSVSITMPLSTNVADVSKNNEIVPFPNPTIDMINIPVGKRNGAAVIEVVDVTGKIVLTKNVNFNNNQLLALDVSSIENGLYIVNMTFENGDTSNFNVVISR